MRESRRIRGNWFMSASAIKERLSRRPFEPFRVVLSSGDAYEVRHPEMALLLRNGIYVAIPDSQPGPPEQAVWCSLLHVASIEPASNHSAGGAGRGAV
jgi:hypothetical protein